MLTMGLVKLLLLLRVVALNLLEVTVDMEYGRPNASYTHVYKQPVPPYGRARSAPEGTILAKPSIIYD